VPLVSATLCGEPSPELTARAVVALTDLTVDVLGKERARTTVVVQYVPASRWARGAVPARGFFVEVRITSGTSAAEDKARYVREVNQALKLLMGGSAGYVAVSEIAADSWGHDGETQEARYLKESLVA
jgi:4-oxalocrotonate tautomerase